MSLGENIRKFRELKGLSGVDFAALVGISQNYLSEIESNKKGGSRQTLTKIAKAFGITIDELLSDDTSTLEIKDVQNEASKDSSDEIIDFMRKYKKENTRVFNIFKKIREAGLNEAEMTEIENFIDYVISKKSKDWIYK